MIVISTVRRLDSEMDYMTDEPLHMESYCRCVSVIFVVFGVTIACRQVRDRVLYILVLPM